MSKEDLSADTEVVLLLCGRFGGEKQEAYPPLAPREYGELAKWLKALALRPSDLLTDAGRVALASVQEARLERKRVEFLLGRGTAMALALEPALFSLRFFVAMQFIRHGWKNFPL